MKSSMTEDRQTRLKKSIETSYVALRPVRKKIVDVTEEYAGPMYSVYGQASKRDKFVNLLKQAAGAYMTLLASNVPRVMCSTHRRELKAFSKHYQTAINKLFEKIEIDDKLRQWVRDAFFWMGIIKVHMKDTGRVVSEGDITIDPGMPWCSNVALDNFVYDFHATSWSECQYMGDIYQLPMGFVQDSGIYSGPELEDLQEAPRVRTMEFQKDVSTGNYPVDRFDPMVDLCDVWIPADGKIYTYVVADRVNTLLLTGNPIAEVEWIGTDKGPYKRLHFDEVSENVLPCSMALDLWPLDRLVNMLYRKNAGKAARAKETPVYTPSGADSARKLKIAADGEWCEVQDPTQVAVIKHGGVDGNLQGFMSDSMQVFDRMAGNLQSMLGLGASTGTVGQEKLVAGQASRREDELRTSFLKATNDLAKELASLLWKDDYTEIPSRTDVPGLPGVSVDSTWKPGKRLGDWDDFEVEINVYSLQYQGPGSRVQTLNELLSTVYIPMLPALQQQGGTIDWAALSDMHADLLNLPQLRDVVLFSQPPAPPAPPSEGPRKPPTSNRNYTRTNVSAKDNSGVPDSSKWASKEPASGPKT